MNTALSQITHDAMCTQWTFEPGTGVHLGQDLRFWFQMLPMSQIMHSERGRGQNQLIYWPG